MKITYISSSTIPSRAANSIHVMKMCQAFARNGHEVVLFARQCGTKSVDANTYQYYGVDRVFNIELISSNNMRLFGGLVYAGKVASRIKKLMPQPDIIYGRNIYSLLACSYLNIPLYYEVHTMPTNHVRAYLDSLLFKKPNFMRHVSITKQLQDEYLRQFKMLTLEKVLVAADGADVPVFALNRFEPTAKSHGGTGSFRIGYAGSLYPGRGIEVIVALSTLLPSMEFHIVGGSEAEVAVWLRKCNTPNLHFHGYVAPSAVGAFLSSYDVLLAPYQHVIACNANGKGNTVNWMSPLKIFEYMSYRKPIVASRLAAIEEILEDGKNALLVSPDNLNEWCDALMSLAHDLELCFYLSTNAYNSFINKYTWEQRAHNVIASVPNWNERQ